MAPDNEKTFDASVLALLADVARTVDVDKDGSNSRLMRDYCKHAGRVMGMERMKAATDEQRQLNASLNEAFAAGARTIERAWRELHGRELG